MTGLTQEQMDELQRIMDQSEDGTLKPRDVLEYARDPETALHSRFIWDDSEAAEKYRLIQARKIIRVSVEVVNMKGADVSLPVFVSIKEDRTKPGGGYRSTRAVMSDAEMKAALLRTADSELASFRARYARLQELGNVIKAIDRHLAKRKPVRLAVQAAVSP